MEKQMLEKITARIQELEKALEQSAAQHNSLVGAMQEAKNLFQVVMAAEKEVVPVVEEVAAAVESL